MNTQSHPMEPYRHNWRPELSARNTRPSSLPPGDPTPTPSACIRAIDLTLIFQDQTLCQHLDFTVPQRGLTVLAPQDTLCKAAVFELLAGRCTPAAGQCLIDGHNIDELPMDLRQQIGIVENSERVYEVMTIGQTAIFFSGCYPQWNDDHFYALMAELRLTRRMKISNLSHQQRALIALAVLLARNPRLLVIDDWITGFDPASRTYIYRALQRYRRKTDSTTLLLGHPIGLAPHLIDHLVLVGHSTALTLPSADIFRRETSLRRAA